MKRVINRLLAFFGYSIKRVVGQPLKDELYSGTMYSALLRLKDIGVNPECIIDVGAAVGSWSENAIEIWPSASFHLIEPLTEQTIKLEKLKKKYSKINIHEGVAGNTTGSVSFSVSEDLDGSGVYGVQGNTRDVPVFKIDVIVKNELGPILIKMDTHGYELPILEGAISTLVRSEVLIIEVYGFYVSPTSVLFHKLSAYLEDHGFRLFDIVDIMRREKDSAFWQADAVYLKSNHPIFADNKYM